MKNFLKIANQIVAKRATVPVLTMMLVDKKQLTVTNMDLTLSMPHASKVRGCVDFGRFYRIVDGKKPVIFNNDNIRVGGFTLKLDAGVAENFPTFERKGLKEAAKISLSWLNEMVDKVAGAMSTEETRYYLNGVYFDTNCAVATDGHRLAKLEHEGFEIKTPFIMPKALVNILPLLESDIVLRLSADGLRGEIVCDDGLVIYFKSVDGKFPEYNRVIPSTADDSEGKYKLIAGDILETCAAVKKISTEKTCRINIQKGGIGYESADGEAKYSIDYQTGAAFETGFNTRYLEAMAKLFDKKDVLEFNQADSASPAKIIMGKLTYVLMPMRS